MFKLIDNREFVYQWDTNVAVSIDDPRVKEAHFCNRTSDCSLVVEVKDGIANVPNIILQQNYDVKVFAYDGKATLFEQTIKVVGRTRPADYVYEETEIIRYEDISKRMNALEENLGSTVAEEVNKYMEENPVEVDLSNYYTKEEVDTALDNVEVDLTGYATEKYVDDAVSNIDIPEVDLSSCAKFYAFGSLENPSEADYIKLSEIIDAKELDNYYFTVAQNKVLRISYLGGKSVLFVYGFWNGADNTTIYAYQVDAASKTSTLLTSYPLASSGGGLTQEEVQDMIDVSINSLGIAEEGEY